MAQAGVQETLDPKILEWYGMQGPLFRFYPDFGIKYVLLYRCITKIFKLSEEFAVNPLDNEDNRETVVKYWELLESLLNNTPPPAALVAALEAMEAPPGILVGFAHDENENGYQLSISLLNQMFGNGAVENGEEIKDVIQRVLVLVMGVGGEEEMNSNNNGQNENVQPMRRFLNLPNDNAGMDEEVAAAAANNGNVRRELFGGKRKRNTRAKRKALKRKTTKRSRRRGASRRSR